MLRSDSDIFDLIQALFPGGSITGCPKKRTMEIIDQLEDFKRGVYTGSAGYMSLNGDLDFNILIRTLLFKDQKVYFNSGGGIVIGSDAQEEYAETLQKAESLKLALS
jgi:para-aminobenzoate synthetase component 1